MGKSKKKVTAVNSTNTTKCEVVLHVILREIEPLIWRRLRMSADMTLDQLHYAIQGAFGWENSHLHAFTIEDGETYSSNDQPEGGGFFGEPKDKDSRKVTLGDLIGRKIKRFDYVYDFGDSWTHEIKIEEINPCAKQIETAECVEGKRNCPPEDCGGVWGYEDFIKAMKNKRHPDHKDLTDWYGGSFDPEKFNLANANKMIRQYQKYAGIF